MRNTSVCFGHFKVKHLFRFIKLKYTMGLSNTEYYLILRKLGWNPASFKDISGCLMDNGIKEMYHAILNEEDIPFFFSIPNLKIFSVCRCHLVAEDGSTAHEHLHALVQYSKGTHRAFKKKMQRAKLRFHSKTTFKPVICPDHAVGVLRYICCEDGQTKKRRDADGLSAAKPHTHYLRSVYNPNMLHSRNGKLQGGCAYWRGEIQWNIWRNLSDEWLAKNVSGDGEYRLHHQETCLCENGKKGKEKKAAANKKRKEFYETEEGKTMKEFYADKARNKHKLIRELRKLKTSTNQAELSKETIEKLMAML